MKLEAPAALEDQAGRVIQEPRMQSRRVSSFGEAVLSRAEGLIRLYPIPLLALGFGIGYLLAREIKKR
jgi:hypothetical protein